MKIGIDVDNTITDTLPLLKQYCKKYNKEVLKRNPKINEKGFATYNLYDWTEKENLDFCSKYLEEVVMQAKVKENAKEVIQKLKKDGHSIYIITARTKMHFKEPYKTTQKFLQKNGIVYDELITGSTDKKLICIKNNIDVMIEDEPQNISSISQLLPVIVLREVYNEECRGKNIIKINNWKEVYNVIEKIRKERNDI